MVYYCQSKCCSVLTEIFTEIYDQINLEELSQ